MFITLSPLVSSFQIPEMLDVFVGALTCPELFHHITSAILSYLVHKLSFGYVYKYIFLALS